MFMRHWTLIVMMMMCQSKENIDLLKKEASKQKSKPSSVRELVKRTLKPRREKILAGCRPNEIFKEFPHLKKSAYVSLIYYCLCKFCTLYLSLQISYEFHLIVNTEGKFL